jgi:hypothetical protein
MFNNIISQFTSSNTNRSSESSNSISDNTSSVNQSANKTELLASSKRNRSSISFDSSPEQDLKKIREQRFPSTVNSSESDTEGTLSTENNMDEEKFANLVKVLLKESEDRMTNLITSKFKLLETLVEQMDAIESTVVKLQSEAAKLHQERKRNNIIVYGIAEIQDDKSADIQNAIEGLSNSLKIARIDFDNAFRLGAPQRNKIRPLLIKLLRFRDKQSIFMASKNLKGTNVFISNDKTKETRIAEAALRKRKTEIQKANPTAKLIIRNEKLIMTVGNKTTTLQYDSSTNHIVQSNRSDPPMIQ